MKMKQLVKQLGGIGFLSSCYFENKYDTKISLYLSKFHKQILQFWKMIFIHSFSPHNSTLWNNRTVLAGRKSIFV